MSIIEKMKIDIKSKPKKGIFVKVESINSGEVVKNFDCGTNQRRADRLESSLLQKTNLEKFHVYQSIII